MSRKLRVGIVGVGNCASSLVQGVAFYSGASDDAAIPGLMHVNLGGYRIGDIEFASAFDISAVKVGRPLAEAIAAEPNNTMQFADAPANDVIVSRGPTLDGLGSYLREVVKESNAAPVDVAQTLRQSRTDVVVCYLPVGSEKAARFYAGEALAAGCAFVNCIPTFIASDAEWAERFRAANLPIIGDDIKSQVGATIVHRALVELMHERGVRLDRTYQLNIGGNADFQNMLERERLHSKKVSKTQAVAAVTGVQLSPGDIHIGPSDHVPWLTDRKIAYIRLEGTGFGDAPFSCEVKLEVWDSPNSAGVVIDAIRCAQLAKDRGLGGPLIGPSGYFMKSPPQQFPDHECRSQVEAFIAGDD